jgi:UDP-N-acetyl-D-galactosamine dehydrogenase
MGMFVANKVVKLMINKEVPVKGARALILGVTFKEDCPDIRNSKVVDIYNELKNFGMQVDVYDPHANHHEVAEEYGITLTDQLGVYDSIVLAVAHKNFLTLQLNDLKKSTHSVVFDIKGFLDRTIIDARL